MFYNNNYLSNKILTDRLYDLEVKGINTKELKKTIDKNLGIAKSKIITEFKNRISYTIRTNMSDNAILEDSQINYIYNEMVKKYSLKEVEEQCRLFMTGLDKGLPIKLLMGIIPINQFNQKKIRYE